MRTERVRTIVLRAVILCAGWWALSDGEIAGAVLGACIVVASLVASLALTPAGPRWQPRGLVQLAILFLVGSLRGGLDVARRALARGRPLSPTMIRYPVRLTGTSSQQLFMGTLSLMPGTLSVASDDRDLHVHLLVDDPRAPHLLEKIERSIANAVGEPREVLHG